MARIIKLKESDLTKIVSAISDQKEGNRRVKSPRKIIKLSERNLSSVVKRVVNESKGGRPADLSQRNLTRVVKGIMKGRK
jgi:hypothetical protein